MQEIATALRTSRLLAPFSAIALQRLLPGCRPEGLLKSFKSLDELGFTPSQITSTLDLLRADREHRPRLEDLLQLVTTAPEVDGSDNRDTSVVVRELFANAVHDVLGAGYAVYQGRRVFQALADRMRDVPSLTVALFLDIQRGNGETTIATE